MHVSEVFWNYWMSLKLSMCWSSWLTSCGCWCQLCA